MKRTSDVTATFQSKEEQETNALTNTGSTMSCETITLPGSVTTPAPTIHLSQFLNSFFLPNFLSLNALFCNPGGGQMAQTARRSTVGFRTVHPVS